jgi:hypothetical protein
MHVQLIECIQTARSAAILHIVTYKSGFLIALCGITLLLFTAAHAASMSVV